MVCIDGEVVCIYVDAYGLVARRGKETYILRSSSLIGVAFRAAMMARSPPAKLKASLPLLSFT